MLDAYDAYDFPTIFQRINQLTTVDLSAFYADVSKDRLYTFAANSTERRSAQTAMYLIADGLARLLGADPAGHGGRDVAAPAGTARGLGSPRRVPAPRRSRDAGRPRDLVARWQRLIAIRDEVNRALEVGAAGQDHRQLAWRAGRAARERRRPAPCWSAIATTCRCCSSCRRSASRSATGGEDRWPSTSRARKGTSARAAGAWSTHFVEPRHRWPVRSLRRCGWRIAGRMTGEPEVTAGPPGSEAATPPAGEPAAAIAAARYARPVEVVTILSVLALDQLSKQIVLRTLPLHETINIIPGLLDLTHVQNTGAAFGLLNAAEFPYKPAIMIGIAAIALVAIAAYGAQLGFHERHGAVRAVADSRWRLRQPHRSGIHRPRRRFRGRATGATHISGRSTSRMRRSRVGAILVLLDMIGLGRHHASHPV